jgi:hypothetical protein
LQLRKLQWQPNCEWWFCWKMSIILLFQLFFVMFEFIFSFLIWEFDHLFIFVQFEESEKLISFSFSFSCFPLSWDFSFLKAKWWGVLFLSWKSQDCVSWEVKSKLQSRFSFSQMK